MRAEEFPMSTSGFSCSFSVLRHHVQPSNAGKNAESVVLQEMNAVTFQEVLRFIYTGDALIKSDNIFSLIVASDFLCLDGLEELCIQYLLFN